jgi:hypothetical protein
MAGIESMIEEVRALHNHVCVVHDSDLARVVGFHEDAFDAYYACLRMNRPGQEKNLFYASMVGAAVSLKGIDHYDQLDSTFALNGAPPTKEFSVTVASRDEDAATYGEHFDDADPDQRDASPES